MLLIFSNRSKI